MGDRKLPEASAAIVCRRAGGALHNASYKSASEALFTLACELLCGVEGETRDALVDGWEEELRRLQRLRRTGLWRAFRLEESSRQPKPGSDAWLAEQMRRRAA